MKKNKLLSIILSLILVFSFTFVNTSDAATNSSCPASSNITYENYIYYSDGGTFYKMNKTTKKITAIRSLKGFSIDYNSLSIYKGWIYFSANTIRGLLCQSHIYRMKTSGSNLQKLDIGAFPIVYKDKIYYKKYKPTTSAEDYGQIIGLYRMSLSGTNKQCIKKSSTIQDFITYKSNLYYVYRGTSTGKYYLKKSNLSGTSSKTMTSSSGYITNLNAYSDYMYFNIYYPKGDSVCTNIYRMKTTSTKRSTYLKDVSLEDISGGYLYYIVNKNYEKYYLYKIKISTSSKTRLLTNNEIIDSVFVTGDYMMASYITGDICRTSIFKTNGKSEIILYEDNIY